MKRHLNNHSHLPNRPQRTTLGAKARLWSVWKTNAGAFFGKQIRGMSGNLSEIPKNIKKIYSQDLCYLYCIFSWLLLPTHHNIQHCSNRTEKAPNARWKLTFTPRFSPSAFQNPPVIFFKFLIFLKKIIT